MIEEIRGKLPIDACFEGFEDLMQSNDTDLCDLFFKYIDFCLAKNYPDLTTIQQVPGHLEAGIIISQKHTQNNPQRLAVLGKSDVEINFTEYAVARVYVKHESVIKINASGRSLIVVDVLDSANVICNVQDQSIVIVNRFIGGKVTGATKINEKNKITYDLVPHYTRK